MRATYIYIYIYIYIIFISSPWFNWPGNSRWRIISIYLNFNTTSLEFRSEESNESRAQWVPIFLNSMSSHFIIFSSLSKLTQTHFYCYSNLCIPDLIFGQGTYHLDYVHAMHRKQHVTSHSVQIVTLVVLSRTTFEFHSLTQHTAWTYKSTRYVIKLCYGEFSPTLRSYIVTPQFLFPLSLVSFCSG